jgi:hypothetical protein
MKTNNYYSNVVTMNRNIEEKKGENNGEAYNDCFGMY